MESPFERKLKIFTPLLHKKSFDDIEKNLHNIEYEGKKVVFIGICGGHASGKTQISQYFHKHVKRSDILSEANFFIPCEKERDINEDEKSVLRDFEPYSKKHRQYLIDKTNPKSYDYDSFYNSLINLTEGKKISVKKFNEETGQYDKEERVIDPSNTPLIIIDGYFIFKDKRIRELLRLKIYKEVEDDVRLSRLTIREEKYLKKNPEAYEIFFQIYEQFFKKTFDENIVIYKKNATVLFPDYNVNENNELKDDETLRLLVNNLNHLCRDEKKNNQ